MKLLRKILVKILGLKGYLKLVSNIYIRIISLGLMKKKYFELHFIKSIIKPDHVVVDIGANLGYYSYFMSKSIGQNGRLIAIEPIPLFVEIWQKNMSRSKYSNYTMLNYAIGAEAKESVSMSIPIVNGVVRHGLTKIKSQEDNFDSALTFDVPIERGEDLLNAQELTRLDYMKCDVEGYEQFVIPSFEKYLIEFKPMLQIELSGNENRKTVIDYLMTLGYNIYILKDKALQSISIKDIFNFNQDFYFVHPEKK